MTETTEHYQEKAAAIQRVLCYFEIFSYPLTPLEVAYFCPYTTISEGEARAILGQLCAEGSAHHFDGYYQASPQPAWVKQRMALNARAAASMPMARRMSALIYAFPFVRSVCISGSLSKHCMTEDGDIDFFIICDPGRLWVCRTLLVLFKKIMLLNSHKYFCVNYFLDTEHLEIEEKNIYTATEVVTLIPMKNADVYANFRNKNAWAWETLPNYPNRPVPNEHGRRSLSFKLIWEFMLSGWMGDWLDKKAMNVTVTFWKRKFHHFDPLTFERAFKSTRYMSRHHPLQFQSRVLTEYEKKIKN